MSFIVDSQGLSKENIDSLYVGHLVLALKGINAKILNSYNAKSSNFYATGIWILIKKIVKETRYQIFD